MILTQNEIKRQGFNALQKNLGISGFIKFIQQFDLGDGDYTKERKKIVKKKTVVEIVKEIR
ncbi:hypothetical protein KA977_02645 [Candidatus Dependentiae bacterium]|nr:hypothetical protein [Candidatus Dependentiae bacterium]